MTLDDLNHEQKVALVALAEAIAMSDGMVSQDEGSSIGRIAEALGEDAYRALLDEAETRFTSVPALQEFLLTVGEKDARELIFMTALEEAMVEMSFDGNDQDLLDWLAKAWEIQVKIDDEDTPDA